MKLCKANYAKSIPEAKELDAREVIQAMHYEGFIIDWEKAYLELNKP